MTLTLTQDTTTLATPARPREIVEDFFSHYTGGTLKAYRCGLEAFAGYIGETVQGATHVLITGGAGNANALVLRFLAYLRDQGKAQATINNYLAGVKALIRLAKTTGHVSWEIEIKSRKADAYRDTRGPGIEGMRAMLRYAESRTDPKGIRDYAILRLMWGLALRRGAISRLDVSDVDLPAGIIQVQEKGRTGKEPRTLPMNALAALTAWMRIRGTEPGPAFTSLARNPAIRGRLTGKAIWDIIGSISEGAGLARVHPHGIRHAAITHALDMTGGDIRKVAQYSNHRDLRILMAYDDKRRDYAGEVAAEIDGSI